MTQLQSAFSHLLPILNDPDYIPIANSTVLDTPDQLDNAFLNNVLCETSRLLLSNDDILPATDESRHDSSSSSNTVLLSSLSFYRGRKRGQMCSYNGYCYALNKNRPDGHRYWDCKDRRQYTPPCKGRLITVGSDTVSKENSHCHPPSVREVGVEHFLSDLRTENSNETPANIIREKLLQAPDAVKSSLPAAHNMKKMILDYRRKERGCPVSTATCAAEVDIPLSLRDDSDGGLFVLDDLTTSAGKRIVAFSSESCLAVLNQAHEVTYIDGTFKTSPKYFKQIWIVRGHIGTACVPLMYFLIEDKSGPSYSRALELIKFHCPAFNSSMFMVDFEKSEHSGLRTHFPNAAIKGCLFHWKQCLLRKFRKLPGYLDNELMKSALHAVYGLAFVPVDDVSIGWTFLKSTLAQYPATATFVTYFESTWLNNPAYPIEMWNHYDSTLSDDPRTNNFSEGSNNALNTAAGCSSPSISRLMDILRRFNAEAELKILQTSTGLEATRKPRNKVTKQLERVKRTVMNYDAANIATYCRSLGYLHE